MVYDSVKDDYEYDESLSADENRDNMRARMYHLYQWAKENWGTSCHAGGAEARAQYLESCSYNDDDGLDVNENDGWDYVQAHLDDYAMVDIMNGWVERGSIYPETKEYGGNGYEWMLDAVGYDIPHIMMYVRNWLDDNEWYEKSDDVKTLIAKDYYDMWEE